MPNVPPMNTISPAELKEAAAKLPPSPRIFGKLSTMLRSPETDLGDITDLVNADSSLTANVLRLSNSALFSTGLGIDTLDEAINRIGFRELFKLVGVAASKQLFSENNSTYDLTASEVWENSLTCGIAMEVLARKTGFDDQEAYTIGLLRNMGKLVIDYCAKNDPSYPQYSRISHLPLIDWEENNFGLTNPTVAGFILSSWNFPEETALTIQYQYTPKEATRTLPLIHLLNLANGIALRIGKGIHGESSYWENWESHLPKTGLNNKEFADSVVEIETTLNRVIAAF